MFNIETDDMDKNNMSIVVSMGCHRVVFLNAFVTAVMVFILFLKLGNVKLFVLMFNFFCRIS